ncbi:hypothetical protein [Chitinophaga filiformis]|uniref:Tetratricopeptide repeat-containing protein n=1 Tax=Chitinophaga filiformis TaxID=104663 RepID=A0A1G7IBY0_CHIFI|nr:hypothetical protein [Chitinophaga filiformis]SDF10068.1 hypothetical protein SAMN04488121_101788 [Chitinophaga filiformis]
MKKLSKRLLLLVNTSLLLVFPYMHTRSCGPQLPVDLRFTLFQPDLSGRNNLAPLYYRLPASGYFYSDPQKKDYLRNCREWQKITGNTVALKDIYMIQYDESPGDFVYAYRHGDWEHLKDNSFVQWLKMPAHKKELDYMAFAKHVEYSLFGNADPWGAQALPVNMEALINTAAHNCRSITSRFLQQRYAFQIVKLHFYNRNKDAGANNNLIGYYDAYLKDKPTIVSDWGLYYYGLVQRDPNVHLKYMLESFDRCEEKKGPVFGNITRQDLDDFSTVKSDKHTIALVQVLKALKQPGRSLPTLQQLYNIEPNCSYFPLLICREVNKLEDWISTPEILDFNSSIRESLFFASRNYEINTDEHQPDTAYAYYAAKNIESDRQYLRSFRNFLIGMLERKNMNKDMIHLAIAHLDNMDGRYTDAAFHLGKLDPLKDTLYQRQAIVEKLIAAFYSRNVTDPRVKQYLYGQFQVLEQLGYELRDTQTGVPKDQEGENKDMRASLLLMLSQRYKQAGDMVTAGLLFQKANLLVNEYTGGYYGKESPAVSYRRIAYFDKYATPEDVEKLIRFKHQSRKTLFEKMIVPAVWAPDDFYRDVKGTLLIRQQRFREAAMEMEKIADDFWEKNWEYKSYLTRMYIGSPGILVPGEDRRKRYSITSKKTILRDILSLQDSLSQASTMAAKARFHYLLGNAYFNISYYGREWMMSAYGQSYSETSTGVPFNYKWAWFSFYPNENIYKSDYYQCTHAFNMYEKALRLCGKDKELHAKILLMLNICDKSRYTFFTEKGKYNKGIIDYRRKTAAYRFPYLKQLKEQDGDTKVFADSRTECPDVAAFK